MSTDGMLAHAILNAAYHPSALSRARGAGHNRQMDDPHATLRDQVLKRVLEGPGESDPALRRAAAEGKGLPQDLQQLVDKIHAQAYTVTDEDLARLQPKYGDDQLFEIIVSAALGASRKRLFAGLDALHHTDDRQGS
jgi:hypothetical protein